MTIREVTAYATSDGEVFEHKRAAEYHEAELVVQEWVRDWMGGVGDGDTVAEEIVSGAEALAPILARILAAGRTPGPSSP